MTAVVMSAGTSAQAGKMLMIMDGIGGLALGLIRSATSGTLGSATRKAMIVLGARGCATLAKGARDMAKFTLKRMTGGIAAGMSWSTGIMIVTDGIIWQERGRLALMGVRTENA